MLELMGKPHFVDTLAPELMLEKLASMGFSSWHRNEQDAVNRILEILTLEIPFECDEDRAEWKAALALLNVAESF
ncbi:hypothetical protein A7985_06225 [Pseudoalteromonas luteoviolacea]|uniref:Uncharacterized protein n=3 Tax=Pseudoalteromonas luteoviolacea TaxID=43657 RepID=A0A1C0TWB2_9GAMM|nr:hypothetical protein A7985_06225 [Pseudoalteromonas luteoviolacea]